MAKSQNWKWGDVAISGCVVTVIASGLLYPLYSPDAKSEPPKSFDQMERDGRILADEREQFKLLPADTVDMFGFQELDMKLQLPGGQIVYVYPHTTNYHFIEDIWFGTKDGKDITTYRLHQDWVVQHHERVPRETLSAEGRYPSAKKVEQLAAAFMTRKSFTDAANTVLSSQLQLPVSKYETHEQFVDAFEALQRDRARARPLAETEHVVVDGMTSTPYHMADGRLVNVATAKSPEGQCLDRLQITYQDGSQVEILDTTLRANPYEQILTNRGSHNFVDSTTGMRDVMEVLRDEVSSVIVQGVDMALLMRQMRQNLLSNKTCNQNAALRR